MALFDQIYEHKNTMQAIEDAEVIEIRRNLCLMKNIRKD